MYRRCMPPLFDFSRALPLGLFEQPARDFFQHPARRIEHKNRLTSRHRYRRRQRFRVEYPATKTFHPFKRIVLFSQAV
jgi:hypothetical protein